MEKYIPLALAIFLTAVGITVEHSIFSARVHSMTENQWMSYGLEGFVFILWALGMFVIGATHQDFCPEQMPSGRKREMVAASRLFEFSK
jgi:ABC-type dipeptide/oligopeptide/nickel transport system permease component